MRIEKIYSRNRIQIKNKKVNKIKLFAFLFVLLFIFFIGYFIVLAYPTLKSNCETAAFSKADKIAHEVAEEIMWKHNYNEFVNIDKDKDGNIILIETNTLNLNKVVSEIIDKIQEEIDNSPTTTINLNYGSMSGITFLKNVGPKLNIEFESAGKVKYEIKSEFEEARI